MRRMNAAALLAAALMGGFAPPALGTGDPRFAEVTLRILTMGDRQPIQEVGVFSSSLPLGRPGGLNRQLTIANETRGAVTTLLLGLSVTPSLDDQGVLHCVIISEAAPKDAEVVRRAKDMMFVHAGEQVMEILFDPATGSRVALAVSAGLANPKATDAAEAFPPVTFLVRVEQWNGAQRVELESIQLQSLEGARVTHDYERKVPRWVDSAAPETADRETLSLESLPVLDVNGGTPTVKAGEGFSIPLTPKEQEKQRKAAAKEAAKGMPKEESLLPEGAAEAEEKPRKIVWDVEYYNLAIEPIAFHGDELFVRMSMKGQILDPLTKALAPVQQWTTEKSLKTFEPTPFYLTREATGGATGYVAWVLPKWSPIVSPGATSQPSGPRPVPPPGSEESP